MFSKHTLVLILLILIGITTILIFGYGQIKRTLDNKEPEKILRPMVYAESPRAGFGRVLVFEYADYYCQHCRDAEPVMKRIREKYAKDILFIWKDLPVIVGSLEAAHAARCAAKEGKFWEYHTRLFASGADSGKIAYSNLATALGLDKAKFESCLLDMSVRGLVERDLEEALALGINSTPTIVIGDTAFVGAPSFAEIERVIKEQLEVR